MYKRQVNGQFRVFAKGGREDTGRDALDWISWCAAHGAGEICLKMCIRDRYGTQFHPEKSGDTGLRILKAFSEL